KVNTFNIIFLYKRLQVDQFRFLRTCFFKVSLFKNYIVVIQLITPHNVIPVNLLTGAFIDTFVSDTGMIFAIEHIQIRPAICGGAEQLHRNIDESKADGSCPNCSHNKLPRCFPINKKTPLLLDNWYFLCKMAPL